MSWEHATAMSRRKPRLFSFAREVELSYFPDVVPGTTTWSVLSKAVDAFASICEDRSLLPARVEKLVAAAEHAHPAVCGLGTSRLAVLSHYFPEISENFAELFRNPSMQIRLFATTALSNATTDIARRHLLTALADSDWQIRKAAAQVASAIQLPGFLADLAAAKENERDARVRIVLSLAEELQRRLSSPT